MSIRHVGLVVKDIYRAMNYYESLGFRALTMDLETWGESQIDVVKMVPVISTNPVMLELIRGNWFNHVSIDVQKTPKNRVLIQKQTNIHEVTFVKDLDKNIIECVRAK
jgi:hypothetical protein